MHSFHGRSERTGERAARRAAVQVPIQALPTPRVERGVQRLAELRAGIGVGEFGSGGCKVGRHDLPP